MDSLYVIIDGMRAIIQEQMYSNKLVSGVGSFCYDENVELPNVRRHYPNCTQYPECRLKEILRDKKYVPVTTKCTANCIINISEVV